MIILFVNLYSTIIYLIRVKNSMTYTHLHWHSTYSFLEAIWTPKQLVSKSKELWFTSIGLTDLFSMYWAVKLYEACKDAEIKPIIWAELWFVLNISWLNKIDDIWNICLLATNTEWYQNLMKIVSVANQEWITWHPKIDINTIWNNKWWIIAFMWWEDSWIWKMIFRSENDDKILELIHLLQDTLWKENVFLEIIAQDESKNNNLAKINKKILELANHESINIITWNIYNYVNKWDKDAWEMALAIKDQKKIFDSDSRKPIWDFYLMSEDEIKNILLKNGYWVDDVNKWMNMNWEIADKIDIKIIMWQALFPVYQTPSDISELYNWIKDSLISD